MSSRSLAVVCALVASLSSLAPAFCGLQSCPRVDGRDEPPALEAGLRTRRVAYDIAGREGSYLVAAPRAFARYAGFALGAEVPLTRLDDGGAVSVGLSNPLLMAQVVRRLSHAWSGEAGLQVELPFGDQEHGLAGDHVMLLPWIGARVDLGSGWHVAGQAGYSHALEAHAHAADTGAASARAGSPLSKTMHEGHEHDDGTTTPVLVNPHADREAQYRVAAGWTRGRGTVEGFSLGQLDVTGSSPEAYARAGLSYAWSLGRFTAVSATADVPVTAARRNEMEIGVGVKTGW